MIIKRPFGAAPAGAYLPAPPATGHPSLGSSRASSAARQPGARRSAVLRSLDMQLRMGEGRAIRSAWGAGLGKGARGGVCS